MKNHQELFIVPDQQGWELVFVLFLIFFFFKVKLEFIHLALDSADCHEGCFIFKKSNYFWKRKFFVSCCLTFFLSFSFVSTGTERGDT